MFINQSEKSLMRFFRCLFISIFLFLSFFFIDSTTVTAADNSITLTHNHSGSSETGSGCYTTPVYHKHVGNTSSGGDCYSPVLHTHSQACYIDSQVTKRPLNVISSSTANIVCDIHGVATSTTYLINYEVYNARANSTTYVNDSVRVPCDACGGVNIYEIINDTASILACDKIEGEVDHYILSCGKTKSFIEYYELGCGMKANHIYGIFSISNSTPEWTSGNVTLTADLVDATGKVRENGYGSVTFLTGSGNIVSTNGNSASVSENSTYYAYISYDASKFIASDRRVSIVVKNIDHGVPTVSVDYDSAKHWIPSNTISVNASDTLSGLANAAYSFDGGSTWQAENSLTVYNNSSYAICVRDNAGNFSSTDVRISNIDYTPPAITVSYDSESTWIQSNTIEISATDIQPDGSTPSGLPSKPYSFDGGSTWQAANTLVCTENADFKICVKDNAGNIAKRDISITNVDSIAPTINNLDYDSNSQWVPENTVTIDSSDLQKDGSPGSGFGESSYSFDGGSTWQGNNSNTFTLNGTYNIIVRDLAGNQTADTITLTNIDSTAPQFASISYDTESEWITSSTVTINATDLQPDNTQGSGLCALGYSFDGGNTWQADNSYTYTLNGTYTVAIKDNCNNTNYETIVISNVDSTAPQITELAYDTESEWTKENIITITANDLQPDMTPGSGLSSEAYSFDGGDIWISDNTYSFKTNGIHTICVKDRCGNIYTTTIEINNIDCTPPTLSEYIHTLSPAFVTQDTYTFNAIDLQPDNSPGCGLNDNPFSYDYGSTWCNNNIHEVYTNGTLTILIRDAIGNVATEHIDISNIDITPPQIIEISRNIGWVRKSDIYINATDLQPNGNPGSGFGDNSYSFDGGNTWVSNASKTYTQNGIYELAVRDICGNIANTSLEIDNIDSTAPTLSYTTTPQKWYQSLTGTRIFKFSAFDSESGLATEPYSYDGGNTWKTADTVTQKIGESFTILVRDNVGNIATYDISNNKDSSDDEGKKDNNDDASDDGKPDDDDDTPGDKNDTPSGDDDNSGGKSDTPDGNDDNSGGKGDTTGGGDDNSGSNDNPPGDDGNNSGEKAEDQNNNNDDENQNNMSNVTDSENNNDNNDTLGNKNDENTFQNDIGNETNGDTNSIVSTKNNIPNYVEPDDYMAESSVFLPSESKSVRKTKLSGLRDIVNTPEFKATATATGSLAALLGLILLFLMMYSGIKLYSYDGKKYRYIGILPLRNSSKGYYVKISDNKAKKLYSSKCRLNMGPVFVRKHPNTLITVSLGDNNIPVKVERNAFFTIS